MQWSGLTRKKNNSWQYIITYKDKGHWRQRAKQGFAKKKDATKAMDEAVEVLKQDLELNTPREMEGITFKYFSDMYLEHDKIHKSYQTITSTETVLKRFCSLNNMMLKDITILDIQKITDTMLKECLKPNTVSYYLKKLTIIFNAAIRYKIINFNPCKGIKIKPNEISKKALTDKECKELLNDFNGSKYYLLMYIALNTGMRIGEILGLTWDDVKEGYIDVNKQWKKINGEFTFGSLKSKNSYRKIPISNRIFKEITSHKKVIPLDNRIFSYKNKASVIAATDRLLKKFSISFHELRHTYITKLVMNGLDFKTVAAIAGHNIRETIQRYSHINDDSFNKASKLIENIF